MKNQTIIALVVASVGVFLLCNGQMFFIFSINGVVLRDMDINNYFLTPIALFLFFGGTGGLLVFKKIPHLKKKNKWVYTIIGVSLLLMCYLLIDRVFWFSYQKP